MAITRKALYVTANSPKERLVRTAMAVIFTAKIYRTVFLI